MTYRVTLHNNDVYDLGFLPKDTVIINHDVYTVALSTKLENGDKFTVHELKRGTYTLPFSGDFTARVISAAAKCNSCSIAIAKPESLTSATAPHFQLITLYAPNEDSCCYDTVYMVVTAAPRISSQLVYLDEFGRLSPWEGDSRLLINTPIGCCMLSCDEQKRSCHHILHKDIDGITIVYNEEKKLYEVASDKVNNKLMFDKLTGELYEETPSGERVQVLQLKLMTGLTHNIGWIFDVPTVAELPEPTVEVKDTTGAVLGKAWPAAVPAYVDMEVKDVTSGATLYWALSKTLPDPTDLLVELAPIGNPSHYIKKVV